MKIFLVCGKAGAGKSTFVRTASNFGFPTFHSGAVFQRLKKQAIDFDGEDMESPKSADFEIQASMYRFLRTFANSESVFLETVPRSIEQLEWVKNLVSQYGNDNVFVLWFDLDFEERKKRMLNRNAGRIEFDMKRMEQEDASKYQAMVYGIFNIIKSSNFYKIDGNTKPENVLSELPCGTVDGMLRYYNSSVNGYFERCGYAHETANFERMITRIRGELDELQEEVNHLERNQESIKMEFADVMHFFFCLANACQMNSDDIIESFQKKTCINQARLQYPSEDKHKISGKLY